MTNSILTPNSTLFGELQNAIIAVAPQKLYTLQELKEVL